MSKVREALFSLLEARGVIWSVCRTLDLFAGSGSLGFEALSRGALEAVFVESDPKAAHCLAQNAKHLGAQANTRILAEDVTRVLRRRPDAPFDVIFCDPPYGQDLFQTSLDAMLDQNWLTQNGWLIAEVEKQYKLNSAAVHSNELTLEMDRAYGQTRILLWKKKSPSIPEPSTL